MRAFAASAGFVVISVMFFIGFASSAPVLMLVMCPGALLALWINGYAAARAGLKITAPVTFDQAGPVQPAPSTAARKPKTMSEFQ